MSAQVEIWREPVTLHRGGFPVAFLLGLMDKVSGGDPLFENQQGARGLYTMHPATAARVGVSNPDLLYDSEVAITSAVELLKQRATQLIGAAPWLQNNPEDFSRLLAASYWYGPANVLDALVAGASSANAVFYAAPAGDTMGTFADDVLSRALLYQDDAEHKTGRNWASLIGKGILVAGALYYVFRR